MSIDRRVGFKGSRVQVFGDAWTSSYNYAIEVDMIE